MKNVNIFLPIVLPTDVLPKIGQWVRIERQRLRLTQEELAQKSNVAATSISRLERTGLSSTDALLKILFAINRLDDFFAFLKNSIRQASLPETLSEKVSDKKILRVRHKIRG